MKKGKPLSKLAASLGYDISRMSRMIDLLRSENNVKLSPSDLTGAVLEGREHLAFQALIELGILVLRNNAGAYKVDITAVDKCAEQLEAIFEVIGLFPSPNPVSSQMMDLAWTLPENFSNELDLPNKSLAGLIKFTISNARNTLFLISPFIEKQGLQSLEGPILGACNRGVNIFLISHGLNDNNSLGFLAYDYLRSVVPSLHAYTSPTTTNGTSYFLIHAKIIVADDRYAVLSSANLTQYGLGTHLELGIGLTGEPAAQLHSLAHKIINSTLVIPVHQSFE